MKITRRLIALLLTVAMLASFAAMTGFEASAASATNRQEKNFGGMYFDANNKFTILQLSDIQTEAREGSNDVISDITKRTIEMAIQKYDPDLIIMTGDQTEHAGSESQWKASIDRVFATITRVRTATHTNGYPLSRVAVTFGNHDGESNISRQNQQNYYVNTKGCMDFDNNYSSIDLYGAGTGCIPIRASSGSQKVAFNVVMFDTNAGGFKNDGRDYNYSRIGHTSTTDYNNILNWYTNMTQLLGNSDNSYRAEKGKTGAAAYVPTLCAQHIILQEIYTTGGLVPKSDGMAISPGFNHSSGYTRFGTNDGSDGLNESPGCTAGSGPSGTNDTRAQYDTIRNLGNCKAFTFGHDHVNFFDVTDNNGFRFLACPGLDTQNYGNSNPGVRVFDLTLDADTGDVDMDAFVKRYNDLYHEGSDLDNGRFEVLDAGGNLEVNTISSPAVMYVGHAANSPSKQLMGDQLQTHIIDYSTGLYVEQDRMVKVCVPSGVESVDFTVWYNGTQVPTQQYALIEAPTVGNTKVFTYKLYSTRLAVNTALRYQATYTTGGNERTIYGTSWLRELDMPAGYNTYNLGYAGSGNNHKQTLGLKHLATVNGVNVKSRSRGAMIHEVNKDPEFKDKPEMDQIKRGYFNFEYIEKEPYFQNDVFFPVDDVRYALWHRAPDRMQDQDGAVWLSDYMQIRPEEAPKSTIYVDMRKVDTVSETDNRLLSGAKLTYYITKDLVGETGSKDAEGRWIYESGDMAVPAYLAGLGFTAEDYFGNNSQGYLGVNYIQLLKNEMATMSAPLNSNPDMSIKPTSNFAYEHYAPTQALNGITTTHINDNYTEANKIGKFKGDTLSFPIISAYNDNTWGPNQSALKGTAKEVTMVAGARAERNSNGYRIAIQSIEIWRLRFEFYDKGELISLIRAELRAGRQPGDYPKDSSDHRAYNAYIAALRAAMDCYAQYDTNQPEIDRALANLNNAYRSLENTNRGANTEDNDDLWEAGRASDLEVPHILYVSSGYRQAGASGTILTEVDGAATPRTITFKVPQGATNIECKVINDNANETTNGNVTLSGMSQSGTTCTWTVNGGTATDKGQVNYRFTYKMYAGTDNEIEFTQYAASYVKAANFYRKGGWYFRVVNTNAKAIEKNRAGVAMSSQLDTSGGLGYEGLCTIMSAYSTSDNITAQGTAFQASCFDATGLTSSTGDFGFAYGGSGNSRVGADEVILYNDRSSDYWDDDEDYGGTTAGTKSFGSAQQWIVCHFYYDKAYADRINSVPTSLSFWRTADSDKYNSIDYDLNTHHNYYITQRNYNTSSFSRVEAAWDQSGVNSTDALIGTVNGTNNLRTGLVTVNARVTTNFLTPASGMPANSTGVTMSFRKASQRKGSGNTQCYVYFGFAYDYVAVDRTAAHAAVGRALEANYPRYAMSNDWWNQYRTAVLNSYKYIGNLFTNQPDPNPGNLDSLITAAEDGMNPANYERLINAVNAAGVYPMPINNSTQLVSAADHNIQVSSYSYTDLKYKVSAQDDSRYQNNYYGVEMFDDVTMQNLIVALQSRVSLAYGTGADESSGNLTGKTLDFRYQETINSVAEAIEQASAALRLAPADFTRFNVIKDLYELENNQIKFIKFNNDDKLQAAYGESSTDRDYANGAGTEGKWWSADIFTYSTANAFREAAYNTTVDGLKKPSEEMAVGGLKRLYPEEFTVLHTDDNPDTTDCYYNDARNAYEALEFRVAEEYSTPTGSAEDGEYTYYANYHMDKSTSPYTYTADITRTPGSTTPSYASSRGFNQAKDEWSDEYNGGVNPQIEVLKGDGTNGGYVTKYDPASWGEGVAIGFTDAYEAANGSTILAIYIQRDIMPKLAALDYYGDNLRYNAANTTQLDAQVGAKADYEIGGALYTEEMRNEASLSFGEPPVVIEDVTYYTTGKTWYYDEAGSVPEGKYLWSEYVAAKNDAIAVHGGSYTSQEQDIVNQMTMELYQKRNGLVPRRLSDYSVDSANAWYGATTYSAINAAALAKKNEIANAKATVVTVTPSPTQTYPVVPTGFDLGEAQMQYYLPGFIQEVEGAYNTLLEYNSDNANNPLASTYKNYRTRLQAIAGHYNDKDADEHLNNANYTHLATLLNRSWIPMYDTYGSGNFDGTSFILGGNMLGATFSGATWYTAETWGSENNSAYFKARNDASQLINGLNYNGGLGYGNNYSSGVGKVDDQTAINTAVTNLATAYYSLRYKTVSDFAGTWNGATGYTDITAKVAEMAGDLGETIEVWTEFGVVDGEAVATQTQNMPVYSGNTAEILAMRNALMGTAAGNANNIASTDYLAAKYNQYLNQLAAYQTAIQNYSSSGYSPVYQTGWNWIFSRLSTKYGVTVTEVNLSDIIANMSTVNMSNITTMLTNKSTFIAGTPAPVADAANQSTMNNYALNLYKALVETKIGNTAKQVNAAITAANNKTAETTVAYDPYQLNNRAKVTTLTKYSQASIDALNDVITQALADLADISLWEATPAVVGYTADGSELDGSLAAGIRAAAGVDSATAQYPETSDDYVLVIAPLFTAALDDAVAFAKETLYVDPNAQTLVQKTTVAYNPDPTGDDNTYNTFTEDSVSHLTDALADVDLDGATQAEVDEWVCKILEHADIGNTIKVKTTNLGLYDGELTNVGADEGLKYSNADYQFVKGQFVNGQFVNGQISIAKPSTVSHLIWDADNNNAFLMNGEGETATAVGAYYYSNWAAYASTVVAGAADSGKKSNQQALVDALAANIYNARNALAFKAIDQSQYYADAEALIERAATLEGQTVVVNRYVLDGEYVIDEETGKPMKIDAEVSIFDEATVEGIQDAMAPFIAAYQTNKATTDITYENAMFNTTAQLNSQIDELAAKTITADEDNEFAKGVFDLVGYFIAGTHSRNNGSSNFNSTQLPSGLRTQIKNRLDAIYDLLEATTAGGAGYEATALYLNTTDTRIEKLNELTDDLFTYCIDTYAEKASFADDLYSDLYRLYNSKYKSTIAVDIEPQGAATLFEKDSNNGIRVFNTDAQTDLLDYVDEFYETPESWPFIYQLNGFDELYDEETSAYDGDNEAIINIISMIGYGSSIYGDLLNYLNPYYTEAVEWLIGSIVCEGAGENGETLVRIKATSASPSIGYEFAQASNASNKQLKAAWYNPGYEYYTGEANDKYYLFKSNSEDIQFLGSSYGSWFTDATVDNVEATLAVLSNENGDGILDVHQGMTPMDSEDFSAIAVIEQYYETGLWTRALTTALTNAIKADQVAMDTAAADFVEAVMALETLPATAEYREIAELIYSAKARTDFEYEDDSKWLPNGYADNDNGGRIFNLDLVEILGEGNYFYDEENDIYYSSSLPDSYDSSEDAAEKLDDIIDDFELEVPVKIDRAVDAADIKAAYEERLSCLEIGKANFSDLTELVQAFLNNNKLTTLPNKGLGTMTNDTEGMAFFGRHSGLGTTGKAAEYLGYAGNTADGYSPTGFYTYDLYTPDSLNAVLTFLKTTYPVISTNAQISNQYNTQFTENMHGTLYDKYYHEQGYVNEVYNELVLKINNLELKKANVESLTVVIADAEEVILDVDYYETTGEDAVKWQNFLDAKAAAEALEDSYIVRQAAVDNAAIALTEAMEALTPYLDEYAPLLTMHNEAADVASFISSHPELGALMPNASDRETGTYIQPNLSGYTMYIYTNKLNPKFVITLEDVTASGGKAVKASKPEKMQIQGAVAGDAGVRANVITPNLDSSGKIVSASTTKLNVAGDVAASSQTAKGNDGKYAAGSNAYAVLAPEFVENAGQQAVRYVIDATDSAMNKKTGAENNQAAKAFKFTSSESAITNAATNNKITIMVYYMNSMSDGNDEGYDPTNTGNKIVGSTVLTEHEQKGLSYDDWVPEFWLYRQYSNIIRNWEFVSPVDTTKVPVYNDPNFATSNLGSFAYVINPNAAEGTFDYYVAQQYIASGAAAAREKAKELLATSTYLSDFKNVLMKSDRFMTYGAGDNWSKSISNLANGTLVYIHVLDRFGNVCNRVIKVNNLDTINPVVVASNEPGKVNVTEAGGSGIQNVDLFRYMGTQGEPLYAPYHLNQYKLPNEATYVSEDDTFRIEGLTPNGLYTLAVKDEVNRVGSCNVYADENGIVTVSATNETAQRVTYNSNEPMIVDPIEDNGMMTFTLNGSDTIILNYGSLSSIVKAGPDGSVFANKSNVPLDIIANANVTKIKLTDLATGSDVIWDDTNAAKVTNEDGTVTWTVKQTFTEGEHSYTATAMVDGEWEPFTVDFSFTATTRSVNIRFITIGMGKTTATHNSGNKQTISTMGMKIVPYGSVVKLVAEARVNSGSEFLCWRDNRSNRITSFEPVMEFTAVTDLELTPQFVTKDMVELDKKIAIYTNNAGGVINSYEFADGEDYEVPAGPKLQDYEFTGWSMTKEQVKASDSKYIIVKPLYTLVISNTVEIAEGNYTVSGAGTYSSTDNERAIVNINASAKDNDGADFLYWRDVETGDIVSYSRAYAFYCIKDTVLQPVYGDASGVQAVPVARISTAKYDEAAGKVSFYAERSIPSSYEVYQTGVILTRTESIGTDEAAFVIGNAGVGKGTSTSTASNGFYAASLSASGGSVVYGRAYIIYRNAAGEIVTDYSPITTYAVH